MIHVSLLHHSAERRFRNVVMVQKVDVIVAEIANEKSGRKYFTQCLAEQHYETKIKRNSNNQPRDGRHEQTHRILGSFVVIAMKQEN